MDTYKYGLRSAASCRCCPARRACQHARATLASHLFPLLFVPGTWISFTEDHMESKVCNAALLQTHGPMPTMQVVALAQSDGIHAGSLKRARKHLGVQTDKLGTGANSEWWLRMKGQTRPTGRGSAM